MGAWKHPGGAVLAREVVEQPYRIADPEALSVRNGSRVAMQWLRVFRKGIGRAGIETTQLHLRTENMPDKLQDPRRGNQPVEDLAFVHEVCQTTCTWFLSVLGTGILAFLLI